VQEELISKGFTQGDIDNLSPFLSLKGDYKEKIRILQARLEGSGHGIQGIGEMRDIFERLEILGIERTAKWI